MVSVTIGDTRYTLRNEWDDITLAEFRGLYAIPVPAKLRQRWGALIGGMAKEYDAIVDTHREIVKVYPDYYGKVIAMMSDIPAEVLKYVDWSLRERLFNDYLWHFAATTLAPAPLIMDGQLRWMEPVKATGFTFKGEQYNLPESLFYGGREVPCKDEKIATFAEASDIDIALHEWGEKGIDAMAQVCAVYLRKPGEQHSDELVIERAEMFKELPMSAVWEVFFCIMQLGQKCSEDILTYSHGLIIPPQQQHAAVVSSATA